MALTKVPVKAGMPRVSEFDLCSYYSVVSHVALTISFTIITGDLTMKRIGIPLWVGALIWVAWAVILGSTVAAVGRAEREGREVNVYLEIFEVMFRIGSLIFGGGQVVLPMLQTEVVPEWMTKEQFLQGLGLAQSMPGPLFNFAAYLGAVYKGVAGGMVAWAGLFGPGIL